MSNFEKIYLTLRGNKSYLVLAAIVLVLTQLFFLSYFIAQTNQKAVKSVQQRLGAKVIATVDFERSLDGIIYFGYDKIDKIGQLPEVRAYDYRVYENLFSNTVQKGIDELDKNAHNFPIVGIHYPQMLEIEDNVLELTKGRLLTTEEVISSKPVAIISEDLATTNNLQLGEAISFEHLLYEASPEGIKLGNADRVILQRTPVALEVIGMYKHKQNPELQSVPKGASEEYIKDREDRRVSTIYTSTSIVRQIDSLSVMDKQVQEERGVIGDVTYLLHNVDNINSFIEQASGDLSPSFKFISPNNVGESIKIKLASIQKISTTLMSVTICVSIVLLCLTMILIFRQRYREFGIYLALGIKKLVLLRQIISELLVVTTVGIIIAFLMLQFFLPQVTMTIINAEMNKNMEISNLADDDYRKLGDYGQLEQYLVPELAWEQYVFVGVGIYLIIFLSSSVWIYLIIRFPIKDILLE
ncbi:MAG: FtsX-like permease family protein [Culicoidibacterales bacterium]